MENIQLIGRISSTDSGSEASLIIPIGEYKILILSDDACGEGHGKVLRSELIVYRESPRESENIKIFNSEFVLADTDTFLKAIQWCQQQFEGGVLGMENAT